MQLWRRTLTSSNLIGHGRREQESIIVEKLEGGEDYWWFNSRVLPLPLLLPMPIALPIRVHTGYEPTIGFKDFFMHDGNVLEGMSVSLWDRICPYIN